MEVEKTYVDSYGPSEIGFAFCHMLGFTLLSSLKHMKCQRLCRVEKGESGAYPHLQSVLTQASD